MRERGQYPNDMIAFSTQWQIKYYSRRLSSRNHHCLRLHFTNVIINLLLLIVFVLLHLDFLLISDITEHIETKTHRVQFQVI